MEFFSLPAANASPCSTSTLATATSPLCRSRKSHADQVAWGHSRAALETIASSRVRRRTQQLDEYGVQRSQQTRYRRYLSELRERLRGVEGKGAAHGRQRRDAIFHRAFAPAARSRSPDAALKGSGWRGIGAFDRAKAGLYSR